MKQDLFMFDIETAGQHKDFNTFREVDPRGADLFESKYNKLGWEEQKRLVPGISDDHSGGTWGLAINAAVRYLPMLLVNKRDKKIDDILLKN